MGEEKGQRCGEVVMGPLSRAGVWSLLEAEPAGTKPRQWHQCLESTLELLQPSSSLIVRHMYS